MGAAAQDMSDMSGKYSLLKATQQGKAAARCACRLWYIRRGAHWRHLTNTIEPSVCSGLFDKVR